MKNWMIAMLAATTPLVANDSSAMRKQMVEEQLISRGIGDERVLAAMRTVEREKFMPEEARPFAYRDSPYPIGHEQTISQPYIVALMTQLLDPKPGDRVFEVGTGSGYQAAVLAEVVDHVYTVEIVAPLAERARETLESAGIDNVTVRTGDGYRGWPEQAPFDAIIVTAAPDHVPPPLVEQLKEGGRMVIPVGEDRRQELVLLRRVDGKLRQESVLPVRFVPMTGEAETPPVR